MLDGDLGEREVLRPQRDRIFDGEVDVSADEQYQEEAEKDHRYRQYPRRSSRAPQQDYSRDEDRDGPLQRVRDRGPRLSDVRTLEKRL